MARQKSLSVQEERVLDLARQGFGDKQIAHHLNLSTDTVRTYWQRIRQKVGAATRAEIVATLGDKRTAAALEAAEDEKGQLQKEINRRKKTEAALRASEREWRRLADSMPHMVFVADADGVIVHHNARFYEYTGLLPDEIVGSVSERIIHLEDLPPFLERVQESIARGEGYETEVRIRRADDAYRWHAGRVVPYRDEDQTLIRWYGSWTDIHESKLMQDRLLASEASLRLAHEMASLGSFEYNLVEKAGRWSHNLFAIFEMPEQPGWFDSSDFLQMIHADDQGSVVEDITRTLTEGVPFDRIYRVNLRSGREILVHSISQPIVEDGKVVRLYGTTQDITAREQTKAALVLSEERFRTITEAYPLGMFVTDEDGNCFYTNPRYREIVGISDEEARGEGWRRALHPADHEKIYKRWREVSDNGNYFDEFYRLVHKNGKIVRVHVRAAAISNGGESHGYVGLVEDVTDRPFER